MPDSAFQSGERHGASNKSGDGHARCPTVPPVQGNDLARWRMAGVGASIRSGRRAHAVRNRRSHQGMRSLADLPCFVRAIDQAECVQHEFSLIRDRAVCSHHDTRADFVRIRALWLIPLDLKVRVTAHRLIAEPLDGA
jgi:hypothetical protein